MKRTLLIAFFLLTSGLTGTPLSAQTSDFPGINFSKADSVAALYDRHPMNNMKVLADKLTSPFNTDIEKFRAIFRWVTNNIEYGVALYLDDQQWRAQFSRDREKLKNWNQKVKSLI